MKIAAVFAIAGMALGLGLSSCGTYNELTPGARSVTASTARPEGALCSSLGSLVGKGGGASGGYVSNEQLIEYAINDLRNQGAAVGATHIVYAAPTMGGVDGTTTSAVVTGEALRCVPGAAKPQTPAPPAAVAVDGCQHDAQCKGERVCVNHACVDPS